MSVLRLVLTLIAVAVLWQPSAGQDAVEVKDVAVEQAASHHAAVKFFEDSVRPLLVEHCFECHGPETERYKGSLQMTGTASIPSLRAATTR